MIISWKIFKLALSPSSSSNFCTNGAKREILAILRILNTETDLGSGMTYSTYLYGMEDNKSMMNMPRT